MKKIGADYKTRIKDFLYLSNAFVAHTKAFFLSLNSVWITPNALERPEFELGLVCQANDKKPITLKARQSSSNLTVKNPTYDLGCWLECKL
jgi:hypothetical protein